LYRKNFKDREKARQTEETILICRNYRSLHVLGGHIAIPTCQRRRCQKFFTLNLKTFEINIPIFTPPRQSASCINASFPCREFYQAVYPQHHDQILLVFFGQRSKCFVTLKTCTMKLSDFIMLSEEQKKYTLLHMGVLVGKRKNIEQIIFLFRLENFYVETFCNTKTKGVTQYRMFEHTNLLQPYLESIAIDELL
jgi:hypothetical protein